MTPLNILFQIKKNRRAKPPVKRKNRTDSTIRRGKETKKKSKAKQTMKYKHYREN
jgi:hypothetical protein